MIEAYETESDSRYKLLEFQCNQTRHLQRQRLCERNKLNHTTKKLARQREKPLFSNKFFWCLAKNNGEGMSK